MRQISTWATLTAVLLISSVLCSAQNTVRDRYQTVEVNKFDVRDGVTFPANYLPKLQDEILKQMQSSKLFHAVVRPDGNAAKADTSVVRLTGTITRFDPGNRAKRYVAGALGATRIFVHLVYVDAISGQPVITEDVTGMLTGGLFGGDSEHVIHEFAEQVVTGAKVTIGKRLPEVAATPAPSPASSGPVAPEIAANLPAVQPTAAPPAVPVESARLAPVAVAAVPTPDRRTVNFTSHDFPGTESRLNAEAAAGYRFADFARTGNDSADVVLEKLAIPAKLEYRVLHTRLPGTLEKEMNKAAGEGYRLCAQTVGQFGGVMTVILEKSASVGNVRYTYRVHQTVRVASIQKDTAKDQSEGYVLAGSTNQSNVHLAVLEKEVKPGALKPVGE